jgi:hypothetical protein
MSQWTTKQICEFGHEISVVIQGRKIPDSLSDYQTFREIPHCYLVRSCIDT